MKRPLVRALGVAVLLVGILVSCQGNGPDPVSPENKYFVQNNTQDTIEVEYTVNPEINVFDSANSPEQQTVAPRETIQLIYIKGNIDYQDTPSLTFASVVVRNHNNTIVLEQDPVEDKLWTSEKQQKDAGYIVTSLWWTLSVTE